MVLVSRLIWRAKAEAETYIFIGSTMTAREASVKEFVEVGDFGEIVLFCSRLKFGRVEGSGGGVS